MSFENDCIFCKIIASESPKVYSDGHVVAFNDISPMAPTHILFVPKKHYASLSEIPETEIEIMGHLYSAIARVTRNLGIDRLGFNTVINTGHAGGQTVFHLHVHLLAGKTLKLHLT